MIFALLDEDPKKRPKLKDLLYGKQWKPFYSTNCYFGRDHITLEEPNEPLTKLHFSSKNTPKALIKKNTTKASGKQSRKGTNVANSIALAKHNKQKSK
jgi:hypothetical protein